MPTTEQPGRSVRIAITWSTSDALMAASLREDVPAATIAARWLARGGRAEGYLPTDEPHPDELVKETES